jgi:hypothetical protein
MADAPSRSMQWRKGGGSAFGPPRNIVGVNVRADIRLWLVLINKHNAGTLSMVVGDGRAGLH